MKTLVIVTLCMLSLGASSQAEDKNGFRITVQKTTLERDDVRGTDIYLDKIDRTLGLKVAIKNISMKEKPESNVEYAIIVSRWGYSTPRYEKYAGTEKLPALKPQVEQDMTLGKARIGGYAGYANKRYQDKIEGWQISIKEGATPTIIQSGANYTRLAEKSVAPAT